MHARPLLGQKDSNFAFSVCKLVDSNPWLVSHCILFCKSELERLEQAPEVQILARVHLVLLP